MDSFYDAQPGDIVIHRITKQVTIPEKHPCCGCSCEDCPLYQAAERYRKENPS